MLTRSNPETFFGHLEGIWGLAGDSIRVVTGANDGMVKSVTFVAFPSEYSGLGSSGV